MLIHWIKLENYRNIREAEIFFGEGINVVEGLNAQGKTNLLEAICFMSLGRSFRRAPDSELIMQGEKYAHMTAEFSDYLRKQQLDVILSEGKTRKITQNRVPLTKMSQLIGVFRAVIFCPSHLSIVKEGPAARRSFIDVALSQLDRGYLTELQRYTKILGERAALLKMMNVPSPDPGFEFTLDTLTEQLCESASIITVKRANYVKEISEAVKDFFSDMTGNSQSPERPSLTYASSSFKRHGEGSVEVEDLGKSDEATIKKELYDKLLSMRGREIFAGATLYGPHKDDIEIKLNGLSARNFASQGQQRSLALALKLAEGEMSRRVTGESPVYLLDDMLSELDSRRRDYIVCGIKDRQVIITTCEDTGADKVGNFVRIRAEKGNFTPFTPDTPIK